MAAFHKILLRNDSMSKRGAVGVISRVHTSELLRFNHFLLYETSVGSIFRVTFASHMFFTCGDMPSRHGLVAPTFCHNILSLSSPVQGVARR